MYSEKNYSLPWELFIFCMPECELFILGCRKKYAQTESFILDAVEYI